MSFTFHLIIALLSLGAAVGFCAGLLGIGGGMLMVPFLTLIFSQQHFPPEYVVHMAIATSMGTIFFTSISSVKAHHQRGAVLWHIVFLFTPGILIGGLLGGGKVFSILKTGWLSLFFGLFVSYSAIQMLLDKKPVATKTLPNKPGMLVTGSVIGFLSSLVGAGGGFISVPFMAWCNIPMHKAVATSAALGFPIAFSSVIGYALSGLEKSDLPPYSLGYIYLPALFMVASMSVLTASWGAKTAHHLPVKKLKKVFAGLLLALASYMLHKAVSTVQLNYLN